MLIKLQDVLLVPAAATSGTAVWVSAVVSLVVTGLMQGAIRFCRSDWLASNKRRVIPSTRCERELHSSSEHSTGGFTGTLVALFFAAFVFGGIVRFLLTGLVVVVAGASVLRRGVRLASRRHARDRLGS